MIVDKDLYILFLENRLKEVKLLHTNEYVEVDKLRAENKELYLKMADRYKREKVDDKIKELKAEIKELRNSKINIMTMAQEEMRELKKEIKELKAENESLKYIKGIKDNYTDDLQAEIEGLKSNSLKNSSLKEYKQEAEEYFEHNPHCKKLLFFMIEGNEFDNDGCYDACLLDDDSIAEIDNV